MWDYYNYMINAEYNYYIFNKGFVQKFNKEEHLEVAGGVNYILFGKEYCKIFCPLSSIRPVTQRLASQ